MLIYGNITKIDSIKPLVFNVKNLDDNKNYKCNYNDFLPVRVMDAIKAEIDEEKKIIKKPLVVPVENEEYLKQSLYICLKGTKFGHVKCEKLLAEFETDHGDINKIFNYLNDFSEGKKKISSEIITITQINKFGKWWKKNYLERKLFLLGLNNKEIKQSYMGLEDLYQNLKINPFIVHSITLEKAKEIFILINGDIKDLKKDIIGGKIIRYLNQSSWSSIPLAHISKGFPEIHICLDYIIDNFPIVFDEKHVYTKYLYDMEVYLANKVVSLLSKSFNDKLMSKNLPEVFNNVLVDEDIILNKEQNYALKNCLNDHISVITGGAGCGKTTLIKQIVKNLRYRKEDFILSSFTGKAVLRMKEILGGKENSDCCYTLSLLTKKKKHNGMIKFKTLIIDEASMISGVLIYEFLKLFDHNFKIILVGDNNQLPPIGICSFFKEIIDSDKVPVYELTENKRILDNEKSSGILENANRLINGSLSRTAGSHGVVRDKKDKNFNFITGKGLEILEGNEIFVYKILNALSKKSVNPDKIVVLTPYNKNIDDINNYANQIFLKDKDRFEYGKRTFILGERVMQTANVYNKENEVMNGEEGIITSIELEHLEVNFNDEKILKYSWSDEITFNGDESSKKKLFSCDLKSSFCKTIHKSQGSEYDFVIIYLPPSNSTFVNVNMLYTAITRAKKTVWIVCDKKTLSNSCKNYLEYKCDRLSVRIAELN